MQLARFSEAVVKDAAMSWPGEVLCADWEG